MVLPSVIVLYFLVVPTGGGSLATAFPALLKDLALLGLGLAVYGALFAWVGSQFKYPLVTGLVFAFGWEQGIMLVPGYLKRLTISYYIQGLVPHAMPQDSALSILQVVSQGLAVGPDVVLLARRDMAGLPGPGRLDRIAAGIRAGAVDGLAGFRLTAQGSGPEAQSQTQSSRPSLRTQHAWSGPGNILEPPPYIVSNGGDRMTKRTRYFVMGSVGFMAVALTVGLAAYYGGIRGFAEPAGPDELNYVAADAAVVAYANVKDLMGSQFRQQIKALEPAEQEQGQAELRNTLGIDIERDIDYVVACMLASPTTTAATPRTATSSPAGRSTGRASRRSSARRAASSGSTRAGRCSCTRRVTRRCRPTATAQEMGVTFIDERTSWRSARPPRSRR